MAKATTMNVPVVATRGMIIFPGQDIMIEVGRPKSMNAVNLANVGHDAMVFIVAQKNIRVEDPRRDDLYDTGTFAKIKIIRRKDGFLRVTFTGVRRARLLSLEDDGNVLTGDIEMIEDIISNPDEEVVLVKRIISQFQKVSALTASFPADVVHQLSQGVSAVTLTDQFAQYFVTDQNTKQKLLETADINERMYIIISELEKQERMNQLESVINEKVKQKIDEGQKEYYLREKLRTIKEELGDVSSMDDDAAKIREKLENNPYPEHVKKKALEELRRFEMLPPGSGEASVQRTYIDWLINVPWWQETEDNSDLSAVRAILDEDHYGLEKVKDRIMEYLAVKQMTGTLNAPILCLVGPPGVGKTSLARSIARSIDRKFVKMSLGGVRDEEEI